MNALFGYIYSMDFMFIYIYIYFHIDSLKSKIAEMETKCGGRDGSPGLYQGKGKDYWAEENIREEMPVSKCSTDCTPFDPVAYRIEPLVCKEYLSKRTVIIPCHKGGRRLHIGFQARNLLKI